MTDNNTKAVTQPTASDLADELEALSKAATQAPWSSEDRRCWDSRKPGNEAFSLDGPGWGSFAKFVAQLDGKNTDHPVGVANRDLTLALRNNLPEILSALRRVEAAGLLLGRVIDNDHAVVCQECGVVQDGSQLLADIEEFLGRKYCRPVDRARQDLTGEA